jgi:hypothetical protein
MKNHYTILYSAANFSWAHNKKLNFHLQYLFGFKVHFMLEDEDMEPVTWAIDRRHFTL